MDATNSTLIKIFQQKERQFQQSGIAKPGAPRQEHPRGLDWKRGGRRLIAEVKPGSPSLGTINTKMNPIDIAKAYERAGAWAISVLTERDFFFGSLQNLQSISASVHLPLLRKDFLFHPDQVEESWLWGADGVLLIASYLDQGTMDGLLKKCRQLGLWALVEIHAKEEADAVFSLQYFDPIQDLFGINNRNLHSLHLDLEHGVRIWHGLREELSARRIRIIAESGFSNGKDFLAYDAFAYGYLVGSSFMKLESTEEMEYQLKALCGVE